MLLPEEMAALRNVAGFSTVTLDAVWDADPRRGRAPARRSPRSGARPSGRRGAARTSWSSATAPPTRRHAPIPMLLAIGAVRQHLVHTGLRARVGLVAEAGDAFDIHHFATLIGYGAEAVHPWLALETIDGLFGEDRGAVAARARRPRRRRGRRRPRRARSYRSAAEKGLLKILSKMGISTLSSYCGAQIFEVLGLGHEVIEHLLRGHRVAASAASASRRSRRTCWRGTARRTPSEADGRLSLPDHGRVRFRKEGEDHGWAPPVVVALQQAVKAERRRRRTAGFWSRTARRRPAGPRDLLAVRAGHAGTARRGRAGGVDPHAASSPRPCRSARSRRRRTRRSSIAMNRMGARSNSGEGGEDPHNYHGFENGDRADNRIKQVASARFGVTTEYLTRAEELEIKIVQGAKPGEGGQLPAHKVTDLIARLRHAVPGISLISPPPHHDIYSIEDLAQLIHDLKTVNPRARVGVKLVSETGVGTVAAGVAKAYADYVLIAGHNGGTGASPLSLHQARRLALGARAGRGAGDAGAERPSAPDRGAHRRRPQDRARRGHRGAARRRELRLRHRAAGGDGLRHGPAVPHQHLPHRHRHPARGPARQVQGHARAGHHATSRCWPRRCGGSSPAWAFGAWTRSSAGTTCWSGSSGPTCRARRCSISRCCWRRPRASSAGSRRRRSAAPRRATTGPAWCRSTARSSRDLEPYLESGLPFSGSYPIHNHHLAVGARVAGVIAERHGDAGLPAGSVRLRFTGSAGQSFGAFTCRGMHLELEGEANDYVGKGLSGGELIIRPFRRRRIRRRVAPAPDHRQHDPLRRDRRQAVRGRPGGRPVRGAELGRGRGDRGRRQPLLRVHDRRHRRRARPRGTELRRGDVERRGLRGRRGGDLRDPGQPGHGGARARRTRPTWPCSSGWSGSTRRRRRARGPGGSWSTGTQFVPLFRKVAPKGAEALVAATRDAYLQSVAVSPRWCSRAGSPENHPVT